MAVAPGTTEKEEGEDEAGKEYGSFEIILNGSTSLPDKAPSRPLTSRTSPFLGTLKCPIFILSFPSSSSSGVLLVVRVR